MQICCGNAYCCFTFKIKFELVMKTKKKERKMKEMSTIIMKRERRIKLHETQPNVQPCITNIPHSILCYKLLYCLLVHL